MLPHKMDKIHISLNKGLVSNSYLAILGILVAVWRSLVSSGWKALFPSDTQNMPKNRLRCVHLVGNTRLRVSVSFCLILEAKATVSASECSKNESVNLPKWGAVSPNWVVDATAPKTWPEGLFLIAPKPRLTHYHSCRDHAWISNVIRLSYMKGTNWRGFYSAIQFVVLLVRAPTSSWLVICRAEHTVVCSAGIEPFELSFLETVMAQRIMES